MQENNWLEILKHNQGFSSPERWISYARQYHFAKVRAAKLTRCPDCDTPVWKKIGQYIYYSTLVNLKICKGCGLQYSDKEIDPQVIQKHFETAYKDENYFIKWRKDIFNQVAALVDRHAPQGGKVIDVGGAKGHLMAVVSQRRPDLQITVNDLSSSSCTWVETRYHFETILGSAADLDQIKRKYDILTAIDVLYYETKISKFWHALTQLVADRGTVIIRVPNKSSAILLSEFLGRCITRKRAKGFAVRIKYFNPEHLYVFSRKYLTRRLQSLGFTHIEFMPAALLTQKEKLRSFYTLYYQLAKLVSILSFGRIIITTSFLVVARRS